MRPNSVIFAEYKGENTLSFAVITTTIGIVFILVVQLGLSGSDGDNALEESGNLTLSSNASDNCTLTYDPDDFSELVREAYVRTFFNVTCLATNGTGDPCDLHIAEEYTHRMFSALRLQLEPLRGDYFRD